MLIGVLTAKIVTHAFIVVLIHYPLIYWWYYTYDPYTGEWCDGNSFIRMLRSLDDNTC